MMQIQVMKSKLHCVTVTQAELDYIGSVTIDEDLMDAANFIENEQVHILNKNNGQRFITYVNNQCVGTVELGDRMSVRKWFTDCCELNSKASCSWGFSHNF